jgi:hypothetical protein
MFQIARADDPDAALTPLLARLPAGQLHGPALQSSGWD